MYDVQDVEYKDLKKCKCCGCLPEIKMKPLMYWVECINCGNSLRYFLNEKSAIDTWNNAN